MPPRPQDVAQGAGRNGDNQQATVLGKKRYKFCAAQSAAHHRRLFDVCEAGQVRVPAISLLCFQHRSLVKGPKMSFEVIVVILQVVVFVIVAALQVAVVEK